MTEWWREGFSAHPPQGVCPRCGGSAPMVWMTDGSASRWEDDLCMECLERAAR